MRPKKPEHRLNETRFHLEQSFATGILDWQAVAHIDFRDLIDLAHRKNTPPEDSELNDLE